MASAALGFDSDWLDRIGRDPRTLGAVQRRVAVVLRDAAVARQVSRRLALRIEQGRSQPPEPLDEAPACLCGKRPQPRGWIIGRCERAAPCPFSAILAVEAGTVPRLTVVAGPPV
jgi:hypothetical protein